MAVAARMSSFLGTTLGIEDAEQLVAIAAIPRFDELESVLGGDAAAFKQLLDQANGSLPPDRAALVGRTSACDLGLGVLMPTPEMMAAAEASAAVATPRSLSHCLRLWNHSVHACHPQSGGARHMRRLSPQR